MSGGITQLVAVGIQDAYLSGSPEISFFRSSFKRYTHFAASTERQLIIGNPTAGGISTVRFEKKGDLLSYVYITGNDSNNTTNANLAWNQIISKIELMIGGQVIDTHDITYTTNIWPVTESSTFSKRLIPSNMANSAFLPLRFFFCNEWQSALPLIALQYHDVELRITWATPTTDQYIVWAKYLYLDKEEREHFAKDKHDMLITQLIRTPIGPVANFEFALSQPVKYIAFETQNYTQTYNQNVPTTSANIQVDSPAYGVMPGMTMNIPGYLTGGLVSNVTNPYNYIGVTYASQTVGTIPPDSNVNFSLSSYSTTNSVAASTNAIANIQFATNLVTSIGLTTSWTAIVSGTTVTGCLGIGSISALTNPTTTTTQLTITFPTLTATSGLYSVTFLPPGTVTNNLVSGTPTPSGTTATLTIAGNVGVTDIAEGWNVVIPQGNTTTGASIVAIITSITFVATGGSTGTQIAVTYPAFSGTGTALTGSATTTAATILAFYPTNNVTGTLPITPAGLGAGGSIANTLRFKMQINGNDIGESRSLIHWADVNQYYLTTNGYREAGANSSNVTIVPFCLDTSKFQPTGSLNFSRIDTFRLICPTATNFQSISRFGAGSYFYAINYNVLRIQNGMGSVLYSS